MLPWPREKMVVFTHTCVCNGFVRTRSDVCMCVCMHVLGATRVNQICMDIV